MCIELYVYDDIARIQVCRRRILVYSAIYILPFCRSPRRSAVYPDTR